MTTIESPSKTILNHQAHEALTLKVKSDELKSRNYCQSIGFSALMGIPFCWVDVEVAKRTTGKSSPVSFPRLLAKRPFLNTPLAVLYGGHYAATKIAGEAMKWQGDNSFSSKLYEGLAMVMVNNPGAQILNRGVIKSLQQSSKSMPVFSSGTALLLGRD